MQLHIENPLEWPAHLPRTPRGRQSNLHGFPPNMTIEDALRFLDDETVPFQAIKVVLGTHIEHFASPRLRKLEDTTSAISVSIKLPDRRYLIVCDRWIMPQHNIYAVVMTLRQIRALQGYGVVDADTLLMHFQVQSSESQAAAPIEPRESGVEPWRSLLGLGTFATLSDANAVYRSRARIIGEGDAQALARLNDAIDQARQHLKG